MASEDRTERLDGDRGHVMWKHWGLCPKTVDDNLKTKNKSKRSHLGVKLVVAEVQGSVDRLKRFKVDVNFLLLAFLCHNGATVHNQTIGRYCKDKMLQGYSNIRLS